jgi:hypothetical protein
MTLKGFLLVICTAQIAIPLPIAITAIHAKPSRTAKPKPKQVIVEVQSKTIILPAATPVILSMDKTLATDKRKNRKGEKKDTAKKRFTNEGETFFMSVVNDVLVDGIIVIPKGSRGVGEVLTVAGRSGFGKSGKIEIQLNYLEVNDKQYLMEGVHLQKGKSKANMAVAGVIVGGPLAGVFIKGEEADIVAGTPLMFRTKENISFEVTSQVASAHSQNPTATSIYQLAKP